jgi:exopolysaccharide biosynthesis protein
MMKKFAAAFAGLLLALLCLGFAAYFLVPVFMSEGISKSRPQGEPVDLAMGDRFQMRITNSISHALDGVMDIKKIYWLSDHDLIAPKPKEECYGVTDDPAAIGQLSQDAQELLDGQRTALDPNVTLAPDTKLTYYLDETIFTATWKQTFGNSMYTVSEIKIQHPSQFRRFLAGGAYGSGIQLTTTEMADSVNAVVASTGDFYAFRKYGIIVYEGKVQRVDTTVDTCYINDRGELLFSYRGELNSMEEAQAFVDEHNIRFSVAFGPVIFDNGEKTEFPGYVLGEVYEPYARSAICQLGPMHYLLVVVSTEGRYTRHATVKEFQSVIETFAPEKAYCLDGGQSAVIAMRGQTINRVNWGYQRKVSDIIYFATALPNAE